MAVLVISLLLLLPATIYFMSPLSFSKYSNVVGRERKARGRRRGGVPNSDDNNRNSKKERAPEEVDDISSNENLQQYIHRTNFPPLEPRIVMLTDNNHTYRFPVETSSFPLSEPGSWELRSRYIELRKGNPKQQRSKDPLSEDCEPINPLWQLAYYPNCNQIHEASGGWQQLYQMPTREAAGESNKVGLSKEAIEPEDHHREQIRLINEGGFRHVWMIRDAHDGITKRVMKTLRSLKKGQKEFDLRNHERHRRDAVAFEELQSSPLVVDLYASCSNTALFDYADRGDLLGIFGDDSDETEKRPEVLELSKLNIMQIAYNVSMSVHDAHHFDAQGRATMAHTDIKTDQFIYQDGYYKLSDFNRARFLTWNIKTNKECGFVVGKNGGEYRSPEEYEYKKETEKVDVYSLGNVLYFLLVQEEVWEDFSHNEVYDLVKAGQRPKTPDKIYKSDGVFERHMIRAMESAWIHVPEERPSAMEVANIIKEGIDIIISEGIKEK